MSVIEFKNHIEEFDRSCLLCDVIKVDGQLYVHISKVEVFQNQLQQKEKIIKEAREDLDKQIEFCTNEADGTINDKYCRIAINYLKHLKKLLDKEVN